MAVPQVVELRLRGYDALFQLVALVLVGGD